MKLSRKLLTTLLACIMFTALLLFGLNISERKQKVALAEASDVSHYFYNQLGDTEKAFYHAMEAMYKQEIFIRGGDYDLVANGHVTQEQLDAYANGNSDILKAMGAARDAFYTDYNEIFYVDFGYLSLRVTQGNDGSYHAYLGSGRAETYYTTGFESEAQVTAAITKYNAAVTAVYEEAKAAKPSEAQTAAYGKELAAKVAQIQTAHAWIAEHTIYKLESTCTPGNEGHVRTPYGVFVAKHDDGTQNKFLDKDQGEALCEGYSRAFKAIMDRLEIPCVLVNGVYRHAEDQEELHMWCYVQLDGEWYAVDQTFDDINRRSGATGVLLTGLGNAYTEDYFLKGYSFMNTQHATSAYKSEAEYAFTYPQLSYSNLGSEISTEHGAMIKVEQEPYDATLASTTIKVSVFVEETDEYGVGTGYGEWCSYAQAAEKGLYLVVRYEGNYLPEQIMRATGKNLSELKDLSELSENGTYTGSSLMAWAYVNPIPDMYKGLIDDYDGYTVMRDTSKPSGFEFAVTTVAPRPYNMYETDLDKIAEMTTFLGDPTMFVARSGFIKTLYGDADYNPPPFIVKATPSSWGKLSIGYSYNIEVEYDQYLKLQEGDSKIQVTVVGMRATGEFLKGTNALVLEKVLDINTLKWDRGEGDNTNFIRGGRISFKFTPSPEYAHDNVMYYFNFNLVGENSGQPVNPVEYCAGYESDACCYKANGFHWSVYAQPQLVESGDLSTEGWTTSDGTDLSETKSRLALVVTSPSKKQNSQMNDLLEDELGLTHQGDGELDEDAFASFTYNISLTICKGVSIETGQGVRIGIGFPEGFTYDDSMNGVMFKAYHFIRDAQNNVVEVEELEVTVTPLGLIILVKSFSPFAIVVTKNDDAVVQTDKTVIINSSSGGTAYAEVDGKNSNLFKVSEGQNRRVAIKANSGYLIEYVKVNGNAVDITDDGELSLNLEYSQLAVQNVIEVNFVAQSVKSAEKARGEVVVVQQIKKAAISVANSSVSVIAGEKIEVKATVTAYGDENRYQWYKDGVALSGQTSETLVIENASTSDSGKYILKVTSSSDSATVITDSEEIEVKVTASADPGGNGSGDIGGGDSGNPDLTIMLIAGGLVALCLVLAIATIVVIKKKRNY